MSKVVKGIGRAVSKVVKGVVNTVKKVAKSKFGKILIGAALVYFGGAALMGAMGSGAAGTAGLSGLAGAAEGISAAWTSLGTAGSQLLAGNLGNAVSALGSGIGGSAATVGANGAMLVNGGVVGSGLTAPAVGTTTGTVGGGGLTVPAAGSTTGAVGGSTLTTGAPTWSSSLISETAGAGGLKTAGINIAPGLGAGAGAAPTGLVAKMMASPYAAPALITAGSQLAGGLISGYGAQKEKAADLARYNSNIRDFSYAPRRV